MAARPDGERLDVEGGVGLMSLFAAPARGTRHAVQIGDDDAMFVVGLEKQLQRTAACGHDLHVLWLSEEDAQIGADGHERLPEYARFIRRAGKDAAQPCRVLRRSKARGRRARRRLRRKCAQVGEE